MSENNSTSIEQLQKYIAELEAEVKDLRHKTRTPITLWPTWGGKRIGPAVQLYSPEPQENLEWLLRLGE